MQREVNKVLKKINVAKLKNNHKECSELYNHIGTLYSEIGSYDEAIYYHEQALASAKTIGDRLATAEAFRYIGETKASIGQFHQGIEYVKKYLDLVQRINDKVELQRALVTLGRVYLMQATELKEQINHVDDKIREISKEAEKRFNHALSVTESIREQIDDAEYAAMKGGIFTNLGLINEVRGRFSDAISRVSRAIEIFKPFKLKEDIHRCHIILTTIFRQHGNLKMANHHSEESLSTAKSLNRKVFICESYIERGLVKICQRDFRGAKHAFAQAYLEKSPNEDDQSKAIKFTKIAHLIVTNYEKLSKFETASEGRYKICDKLGDLFVAVNNYKLAVEFYKRALNDAKICRKPKPEIARILYSVGETYADDGQFEHALACFEKELVYRAGNQAEQCQSLIKIAQMHERLERANSKVSESYEKALDKAGKKPTLMYNVLRDYIAFLQKKSFNLTRCKELEDVMLNLKSHKDVIDYVEHHEEYEEANDIEDEIANIDDIITDDEGNDEVLMVGRKRTKGSLKFKPNEVGDTPLHEACIKGDLKRVKSLLSQGHDVNPRDNAGWIPLHEACNHGFYEIAEYLIENGADVSNRGMKGMTPLHDAATNGHFEIMRLLMRNGANVIALTDSGETILTCLRDYKKRAHGEMTNQKIADYKLMESELLHAMDRCGFNLMEVSMKNPGSKRSLEQSQTLQEVQPKTRNLSSRLETDDASEPVKDYRNAMCILKRKRPIVDQTKSNKKANLPATFESEFSTSAKTKDWLIDDVSKEKQILRRRQPIYDVLESSDEEEEIEGGNENRASTVTIDDNIKNGHDHGANNEDDGDDIVEVIEDKDVVDVEISDPVTVETVERPLQPDLGSSPAPFSDIWSENSRYSSTSRLQHPHMDLTLEPLAVQIEDKKLLVPIKDVTMTIKSLRESVVDRYVVLTKAKPVIRLGPASDPSCYYYDGDFCQDVIREGVVATIEGWELKSLVDSYVDICEKQTLEPLTYIMAELKRIEQVGLTGALDLSFVRLPRPHVIPFAGALSYRDFSSADLTGGISLFVTQANAEAMLDCISTWKKLARLNTRCVGLRTESFELFCDKIKGPELKSIDLSYNAIVYKANCSENFMRDIEKLRQGCRKLEKLEMRRNNLLFVSDPLLRSLKAKLVEQPTAAASTIPTGTAEEDPQTDMAQTENKTELTTITFELEVSDQNNFTVY